MKPFAKNINRLPIWLFAILGAFIYFIANTADVVSIHPSLPVSEKYFIESSLHNPLHKEHPATFSSFDSPQVYVQNRKVEDKGKSTSKYYRTGTFIHWYAATDLLTYSFQFLLTHFFKYLFILYCVLLI